MNSVQKYDNEETIYTICILGLLLSENNLSPSMMLLSKEDEVVVLQHAREGLFKMFRDRYVAVSADMVITKKTNLSMAKFILSYLYPVELFENNYAKIWEALELRVFA